MSNPTKTGLNWSYDGDTICIFDEKGRKLPSGMWEETEIGDWPDKVSMYEYFPVHIGPMLYMAIEQDRAAGKAHEIAYLGVGPRFAVHLFLEGILTLQNLEKAQERHDCIVASIQFDGHPRKLVIMPVYDLSVGTYDVDDREI